MSGSLWPAGHKLLAGGGRSDISLVEINGRPAVALRDCAEHDLLYIRASDSTGGLDWPEATVIDNTDENTGVGIGAECQMLNIGDKPAIAYTISVTGNLMYAVWE